MDIVTTAVFVITIAAFAARVAEILTKRPETFGEMMAGARPFAERALRESALMAEGRDTRFRVSPERSADQRPALAA